MSDDDALPRPGDGQLLPPLRPGRDGQAERDGRQRQRQHAEEPQQGLVLGREERRLDHGEVAEPQPALAERLLGLGDRRGGRGRGGRGDRVRVRHGRRGGGRAVHARGVLGQVGQHRAVDDRGHAQVLLVGVPVRDAEVVGAGGHADDLRAAAQQRAVRLDPVVQVVTVGDLGQVDGHEPVGLGVGGVHLQVLQQGGHVHLAGATGGGGQEARRADHDVVVLATEAHARDGRGGDGRERRDEGRAGHGGHGGHTGRGAGGAGHGRGGRGSAGAGRLRVGGAVRQEADGEDQHGGGGQDGGQGALGARGHGCSLLWDRPSRPGSPLCASCARRLLPSSPGRGSRSAAGAAITFVQTGLVDKN